MIRGGPGWFPGPCPAMGLCSLDEAQLWDLDAAIWYQGASIMLRLKLNIASIYVLIASMDV